MIYRYLRLFEHDLSERLGQRLGEHTSRALAVAAILGPLALTAGVGWLFLFWLAITFVYQSRIERALSGVALGATILLALSFEFYSLWTRTLVNPLFRSSMSALSGTFVPTDVQILESALRQAPEDRFLRLLLAIQLRNLGEDDRAASIYREILKDAPEDVAARINLGNIYYSQGDYQGAVVQYRLASEADSRSAVAHYNKSLAHVRNFEFPESAEARALADQLDPGLADSVDWLEIPASASRREAARSVVDVQPSTREILGKFWGLEQGHHPSPLPLGGGALWWGRARAVVVGGMILALAVVVGMFSFLSYGAQTQRCWKCGQPFCGRCQIGSGRRGLCTQCHHLFIVKDGVSAAARSEKMTAVQKADDLRRRVFRILTVVAPGAGQVAEDRTLVGIGLLTLWVGGWVLLLAAGYPSADAVIDLTPGTWGTVVPFLMLAAALAGAHTLAQPELGR
jgi:tetratricopeptide (TPR) repeat protein